MIDDHSARICIDAYSQLLAKGLEEEGLQISLRLDKAFEIAKQCLQEKIKAIWDWEEDVSLLNLAVIQIAH